MAIGLFIVFLAVTTISGIANEPGIDWDIASTFVLLGILYQLEKRNKCEAEAGE